MKLGDNSTLHDSTIFSRAVRTSRKVKVIYRELMLVKVKVKPILKLFLPELMFCYQKKPHQAEQLIPNIFPNWNCNFLEVWVWVRIVC